jgi:hypothetical protein
MPAHFKFFLLTYYFVVRIKREAKFGLRFIISDIKPEACKFEQSFSNRRRQNLRSKLDCHRHACEEINEAPLGRPLPIPFH